MYPDPITPRSFPEKLQELSYDPFHLMPRDLPPPPRVFVTAAELERTRGLVRGCSWAKQAMELLLANCERESDIPAELPATADPALNRRVVFSAERNALAHLLVGRVDLRERALAAFRLLARAYPRWPITRGDVRAAGGGLSESGFNSQLGRTYDLLAASGLDTADDASFREMLGATRAVTDGCLHRACGNHTTWNLASRLAVATALGDLQGIHDTLYGCRRSGQWRYGLIHQLRHDILSDGMHWERTAGYHYYTLMGLTELASILAHLGVDLWHVELPTQNQDDSDDLHRAYGPRGTKCLKAAYDAPFYQSFGNRDLSLVGDSGLANLRGVWIWGIIYNRAYEAYGDPKYAWLLNLMEKECGERQYPELPMPLQTWAVDLDFARISQASYPEGRFSLADDCRISLCGRHEKGCTLFPVHGSAVLRGDAAAERAASAFIFWGPHSAGHQSPAALHLDLHAGDRRITDAPRTSGYDDPNYLTWARTTIAHNTVTVDETPMFPYDFETESIWECDRWRDSISDGELVLWQPQNDFKAIRACNDNVYAGVRLDRTVLVTREHVIDVFRVLSDLPHQYDWAMHVVGELPVPDGAAGVDLGRRRGYQHLSSGRQVAAAGGRVELTWECEARPLRATLLLPRGAAAILARDPLPAQVKALGELALPGPRACVLVRAHAAQALFVSLWTLVPEGVGVAPLSLAAGSPGTEVELNGAGSRWLFPFEPEPVRQLS